MCSISGAPNLQKGFNLYKEGLLRGHYSSGLLIMAKDNFLVFKQKNPFTLEEILSLSEQTKDVLYCAFHSRAPTNVLEEKWNSDTTHPFNYKNYYVSHNGIINNFKTFENSSNFLVDSSIIPYHLYTNNGNISSVYEKYTGLLTSWIFNSKKNNFFVVKAGSSLYMDEDSFSSMSFEGAKQIEEDGLIFKFTEKQKLEKNINFNYSNPYFIL